MSLLRVSHLSKRFDPRHPPAVDDIDFTLERGEILALLGPSGCGKTTTLRMLAGFERPDSGHIELDQRPIMSLPPERRQIGIVFQDYALFPHLTVLENVMFGLKHLARKPRREKALALLRRVGLHTYTERMPDQLSGGQQQRVALIRALATEPRLILLDEPFSNLDAALRQFTRDEVRALLKATHTSAILVTHDQEEALSVADRIGVMNHGRIEQLDTPENVYHHPATRFVAQFLGRTNLLTGKAHGGCADTSLGCIAIHRPVAGEVLLSLRPEHIALETANDDEPAAQVISREFRGHDLSYRLRLGDTELIAQTDYDSRFRPGDRVRLSPREAAVVLENSLPQQVHAAAAD